VEIQASWAKPAAVRAMRAAGIGDTGIGRIQTIMGCGVYLTMFVLLVIGYNIMINLNCSSNFSLVSFCINEGGWFQWRN
jgi:hypothetical protein